MGGVTVKATLLTRTAGACFALTALLAIPTFAQAEQKIGKTLDEMIELAKQEPVVTFATTWEGEIIEFEKKGFKEKYGLDFDFFFVEGVESREKVFNEALAGVNEVDLVNMSTELQDKFIEANLVVPVDYKALFPAIPEANIRPGGHYVATGWNQFVIAYNPTLVSDADAPKDWQDCLDPKWKGKIGVYTRPLPFIQTYFKWGKDEAIKYHTALKAQEPVWTSSTNSSVALLAAGEFPVLCGIHYHAVKNVLRADPNAPVKVVVPKLFPIQAGEKVALMADADSPNAAILLAGFLATDGAPGYDLYGRSDPQTKGTDAYRYSQEAGATPYWSGWETSGDVQAEASKAIVEAWGFPKGK
jgi:iron(III) transport system substrate-binding protein